MIRLKSTSTHPSLPRPTPGPHSPLPKSPNSLPQAQTSLLPSPISQLLQFPISNLKSQILSLPLFLTTLLLAPTHLRAEILDDIKDIRPPQSFGFWETNATWAIPAILIALALLGLILYLTLRKKPAPPLSPYQRAQIALGEAASLISSSDDKAFSIAVSSALRHYLEGAFRLRAPEQTTEEFLQQARGDQRIPAETLPILEHFLSLCDLAKFARHAFGEGQRRELLDSARSFVDETHRQRLDQLQQPLPTTKPPQTATAR